MDRLTQRNKEWQAHAKEVGYYSLIDKLAEYEDLEEQGLLLRLPVKEGTTVYVVYYIFECKHNYNCPLSYDAYKCEEDIRCEHEYKEYRVREAIFNHRMIEKIGETVFLTKEKATEKFEELTT